MYGAWTEFLIFGQNSLFPYPWALIENFLHSNWDLYALRARKFFVGLIIAKNGNLKIQKLGGKIGQKTASSFFADLKLQKSKH